MPQFLAPETLYNFIYVCCAINGELCSLNMTASLPAAPRIGRRRCEHRWRLFACGLFAVFAISFLSPASAQLSNYAPYRMPAVGGRSCVAKGFRYPRDMIYEQKTANITLQVSHRPAHLIVTNILKILLEDVIGYRNVILVHSNDTLNASAVLDAVSGMDQDGSNGNRILPSAMINVEVWMPPGFNAEPWELSGGADHLGSLASVGKFGWFVSGDFAGKNACEMRTDVRSTTSSYQRKPSNPKINYEFWRAYRDISAVLKFDPRCALQQQRNYTAKLFRSAVKEECRYPGCERGIFSPPICGSSFYDNSAEAAQRNPCAVLLIATFNLQSERVLRQIKALNLRVVVIFVGSQLEGIVNERERAGLPTLFFDYEPSVLTASSKFRRIAFEQCAPNDMKDSCDFLVNQLSTVAWSNLAALAPDVFNLTVKLRVPQSDYTALIKAYAEKPEIERSSTAVYDIACNWILSHEDEWRQWAREIKPKRLRLSGLFPLFDNKSADKCWGKSLELAARIAVRKISDSPTFLSDYTLEIDSCNDACAPAESLNCFMYDYLDRSTIGFVGPACSDAAEPIVAFGKFAKTLVVSYGAEASGLTNRQYYPYFYRTIPDNSQLVPVYAYFMREMGWTRLASISEDGQKYPEYLTKLQVDLGFQNMSMLPLKFSRGASTVEEMMEVLSKIKAQRRRIIIGDFFEPQARAVMCAAHRLQMTAAEGYVWFLPNWFTEGWYDPRIRRKSTPGAQAADVAAVVDSLKASPGNNIAMLNADEQQVPCDIMEMISAINYHFTLEYRNYERSSDALTVGNYSIVTFYDELRTRVDTETHGECRDKLDPKVNQFEGYTYNKYSGFAHDAVWVLSLAYDRLLRENLYTMPDLTNEHTIRLYADYIEQTNFHGVSGHVYFRGGNRVGDVFVRQRRFHSLNLSMLEFDPDLMEMQLIYEFDMGNVSSLTDSRMLDNDVANFGTAALLGGGKIMWGTKDGKRPDDGTIVVTCGVEPLANWLGLSCMLTVTVLVVFIVGVIVLIASVSTSIVWAKYKHQLMKEKELRKHLQLRTGGDLLELTQWELQRSDVHLNRKIGRGNFGKVYGGEALVKLNPDDPAPRSLNVAIKCLKDSAGLDEKLDFLAEAEIMRRLSHEHIVKLYGVTTGGKGPLQIIFEFALHGDVKTYLLSRREMAKQLPNDPTTIMECGAELLTRFARDIACGLSYMHEMRLIHRDLAARNCLVSADRRIKIGDFGMCRPVINSNYYHFTRRGLMPVRWMAPESLSDGYYTTASDVWSFGVVLYEIASLGGFPYPGKKNAEVIDMVKRGRRMKAPEGCVDELDMVFLQACHQFEAAKRPTASKLFMDFKEYDRVVTPCIDEIDMFNNEIGLLTDAEDVDFQGHEVPPTNAAAADGIVPTNANVERKIRRRGKQKDMASDTVDAGDDADDDIDEEAAINRVRSLSASGRSDQRLRLQQQQPLLLPATTSSAASPRNAKHHNRGSSGTTASQQSINKLGSSQVDLSQKATTRAEDKAKRQELSKYLQRLQASSSSHFPGLSSLTARAKRHASGTSSRHGDDEMEMTPTKSNSSARQRRWRLSSADHDNHQQHSSSSSAHTPNNPYRTGGFLSSQQQRGGVHTPPNSNSAGAVVVFPGPQTQRRSTSAALMEAASDDDPQQQPNFLRAYNPAASSSPQSNTNSFFDRSHCVLPPINGSSSTALASSKPPAPPPAVNSSLMQRVVAAVHPQHNKPPRTAKAGGTGVDERPMLHEASVKFWHKRGSNVTQTDSRKSSAATNTSSSASDVRGGGGASSSNNKPNTCQRNVPTQLRASSSHQQRRARSTAEADVGMPSSRRSSASGISSLGVSEAGDFNSFNDEQAHTNNPAARFDVLGGGGGGGALYNTHSLISGMSRGVNQRAETIGMQPECSHDQRYRTQPQQQQTGLQQSRQYLQPAPVMTQAPAPAPIFGSPPYAASSLPHRQHLPPPKSPQPVLGATGDAPVVAPLSSAHLRILEKIGGHNAGAAAGEPSSFAQPVLEPSSGRVYAVDDEPHEQPHVLMARKASYPTPIAVTDFRNNPSSGNAVGGKSRIDYAEVLPLGGSANSYIAMDGRGAGDAGVAFPDYPVPSSSRSMRAQQQQNRFYPNTATDAMPSNSQSSSSSGSAPRTPLAFSTAMMQQPNVLVNPAHGESGGSASTVVGSSGSKAGRHKKAGSRGTRSSTNSGSRSEHSSGDRPKLQMAEAPQLQHPFVAVVPQQQQQLQLNAFNPNNFYSLGINAPIAVIPLSANNNNVPLMARSNVAMASSAVSQPIDMNHTESIPSREEQLRRLQQHQMHFNSPPTAAASQYSSDLSYRDVMAMHAPASSSSTLYDQNTPSPTTLHHLASSDGSMTAVPAEAAVPIQPPVQANPTTEAKKVSPVDSGRGGRFPRQSSGTSSSLASSISPSTLSSNGGGGSGVRRHDHHRNTERARDNFHQQRPSSFANAPHFAAHNNNNNNSLLRQHLLSASSDGVPPIAETGRFNSTGTSGVDTADDDESHQHIHDSRMARRIGGAAIQPQYNNMHAGDDAASSLLPVKYGDDSRNRPMPTDMESRGTPAAENYADYEHDYGAPPPASAR